MAALLGCGSDGTTSGGDTPGASLVASPTSVTVTDKVTDTTVYLSTSPSGGHLQWQITGKPAWLTVSPASGVVSGITPIKLSAAATPTMDPGTTIGRLDLVSSGGAATIQVSFTVASNPLLALGGTSVSIAAGSDTAQLTLNNPGRGLVGWSVSGQPAWLTAIPASGSITSGGSAVVKLAANRTTLPAGTSTTVLTFKNNNTNASLPLNVSVDVAAAPRAVVSTGRLVFSPSTGSRLISIANPGKGPLAWQVSDHDSWLTVSPSSGSVAAGDSARVTVTSTGSAGNSGGFTLTSNAVDAPSVRVAAIVLAASPPLGAQVLDHEVIHAAFSAASGLLATVSASPARLNVFDLETGDSWSIGLPKDPCCVALRADGRFAAVAHDAAISYVDIAQRQIVKTYAITSNSFDVLLPSNGYVYVWPRTDQWQNVHAVNLATGLEENGTDLIYAGSHAKLHPSGTFAYDIWFLSPADLEKFDLSAGRPRRLGDSPYHGDFAMGYNLWFSPGGDKIFTEAGTVFRSSSSTADDMRYMGTLPGAAGARMIAEDATRARIYSFSVGSGVGFSGVDPSLRTPSIGIYSSQTLSALSSVPLPQVTMSGKLVDVDGYYLFPSADGRRLYMLVKAVQGSGLTLDWALYVVDRSTLP